MNRMMGLGLFLLGLAVGLLWCGMGWAGEPIDTTLGMYAMPPEMPLKGCDPSYEYVGMAHPPFCKPYIKPGGSVLLGGANFYSLDGGKTWGAIPHTHTGSLYELPESCSTTTAFPNRHKVVCSEDKFLELLQQQAGHVACLTKMEEAMRMWDVYINQLNHDKPITYLPGDQSLYDVWNDAKHCWRTP